MRRLAVLLFTALWFCSAFAKTGKTPAFTSFDFPGAVDTQATAITPSREIVGRYTSTDVVQHGFILSKGNFSSIDVPGAIRTDAQNISPTGQIVGYYDTPDGGEYGYVLRDCQFTTITYPGALLTVASGIGPDGEIVGGWLDSSGELHGFVLDNRGIFTVIDIPGAFDTVLAQTAAGRMVGAYGNFFNPPFNIHAFIMKDGDFQTIDFPGCDHSFLSSLNPQGDAVGGCLPFDGSPSHGYMVSKGQVSSIHFPGSLSDYANGINPRGDIVGRYAGADLKNHGYLRMYKP